MAEEFEWDAAKEAVNLVKHGITFDDATVIWDGPTLEMVDRRRDYGEVRFRVLGVCNKVILHVVFTWRDDARRIISARRANRNERQQYYQTVQA